MIFPISDHFTLVSHSGIELGFIRVCTSLLCAEQQKWWPIRNLLDTDLLSCLTCFSSGRVNSGLQQQKHSLCMYLNRIHMIFFENVTSLHDRWHFLMFPWNTNFTGICHSQILNVHLLSHTSVLNCTSESFYKLTCSVQLTLFFKNSTNLSTTPGVFITSSIGGLGSEMNRGKTGCKYFCCLVRGYLMIGTTVM